MKEIFRLKFAGFKRLEWLAKENLSCNEMLLDFEQSNGPKILGMPHFFFQIKHIFLTNHYFYFGKGSSVKNLVEA